MQDIVRRAPVAEPVVQYAMSLVRKTRVDDSTDQDTPDFIKEYVSWGAGPRACQCLVTAGKAKALLSGRFHVAVEDIDAVAPPVLRHRILTHFHAEARG